MDQMIERNRDIPLFLLLTLLFSSVSYFLIIKAGTLDAYGGLYVYLLMWSPGLAAIITSLVRHGTLRGLGWHWGKTRYQILAYFLPLFYAAVVYLTVWGTGLGAFDYGMLDNFQDWGDGQVSGWVALIAFVGLGTLSGCFSALGEEIGWRGFLVPALYEKRSFLYASLISGVIWALWHTPLILFADYHSGTPQWYSLLCFTFLAIGVSFILAWLRLKSGSVWTAMFLHASHNLYIQNFFDRVTIDTGYTPYITTEFGVGLALVTLLLALYFYRRRDELYRDPEAVPY